MTEQSTFYHFKIELDPEPDLGLPAASLSFEVQRYPTGNIFVHVGSMDISNVQVAHTETFDDQVAIDRDPAGRMVGVELLSPVSSMDRNGQFVSFFRAQTPEDKKFLRTVLSTLKHYWASIEVGGQIWGFPPAPVQESMRTSHQPWQDPSTLRIPEEVA